MINLETIALLENNTKNESFKTVTQKLIEQSQGSYIHQLEERLRDSRKGDGLLFSNAYLALFQGTIFGYLYVSSMRKNSVYLEYMVLEQFRGQHLGSKLLDETTNFLFENFDNLKEIHLDISRDNQKSINTAESCGYYFDSDTYDFNQRPDRLDYVKDNPYYKDMRRNR